MEKHFQKIVKNQKASIALLKQVVRFLQELNRQAVDQNIEDLDKTIMDNTDLKQALKIGDTKLFELKKDKIFPTYRLKGKDYYLKQEIIDSIRKNKTI